MLVRKSETELVKLKPYTSLFGGYLPPSEVSLTRQPGSPMFVPVAPRSLCWAMPRRV